MNALMFCMLVVNLVYMFSRTFSACTLCIMTPLPFFCMLTSAPLSNSIFTQSTCPSSEAAINAVHPSCNEKCMYSCVYHQCQIHNLLMYIRGQYTRTNTTYSSTQHFRKRGKLFIVRYIQCSFIHHNIVHLSYPPTPPHTTSLFTLLIHCSEG